MKTALIITTILAALAVTGAVVRADEVKPVTLEITSGSANTFAIVTKAKTKHPFVGSGGWNQTRDVDGLTFLVGEAEITVPWNRIKSVTKPGETNWDVTLELVSGEKQQLRIVGNSGDYIEGETSLGKFEILIRNIKTIKTGTEQQTPGAKR